MTAVAGLRLVALLRGVNVGGHNPVPMAALRGTVEALGHRDVVTYIQSGNIVFTTSGAPDRAAVAGRLEAAIVERHGVTTTVVLRSHDELVDVDRRIPFPADAAPTTVQVMFLDAVPTRDRVDTLDHARFAPDRAVVDGRELFMYAAGGFGRSKLLPDRLAAQLGVVGTARNLNTVRRLIELSR